MKVFTKAQVTSRLATSLTKQEPTIKVNGEEAFAMVRERCSGRMVLDMKEIGSLIKQLGMASFYMLMEISSKVTG